MRPNLPGTSVRGGFSVYRRPSHRQGVLCASACAVFTHPRISLLTAVGIVDLYRAAKNATTSSGSLEPLFIAGLVYLLLNSPVTWCFSQLHKRAALP